MKFKFDEINWSDLFAILGVLGVFWKFVLNRRRDSMPIIELNYDTLEKALTITSKEYTALNVQIELFSNVIMNKNYGIINIPIIPVNQTHKEILNGAYLFETSEIIEDKDRPVGKIKFYSEDRFDCYQAAIYIFRGNLYLGKAKYIYDI